MSNGCLFLREVISRWYSLARPTKGNEEDIVKVLLFLISPNAGLCRKALNRLRLATPIRPVPKGLVYLDPENPAA